MRPCHFPLTLVFHSHIERIGKVGNGSSNLNTKTCHEYLLGLRDTKCGRVKTGSDYLSPPPPPPTPNEHACYLIQGESGK